MQQYDLQGNVYDIQINTTHEKTAKEMFEKLGYKLDTQDEYSILYCKDILDKNTFGYIDSEMIYFEEEFNNIYFTNKDCLTMEELRAINKQCKELGWLDE